MKLIPEFLKKKFGNGFFLISLVYTLFFGATVYSQSADAFTYGRFGKMVLYHPKSDPNAVVLFVSGDEGWQNLEIQMAKSLADEGALVVGIDARPLTVAMEKQKAACYYPAGDFEQLSMVLQRKYSFKVYQKPILAGYSFGATLVYGLLVQAPAGTFKGGIVLGFSPDINLKKPLCKGSGLITHSLKPGKTYYLNRIEKLAAPLVVLNGVKDQVCPFKATDDFLKGISGAELIALANVGHGFSVTANNWMPQFKKAYSKILGTDAVKETTVTFKTSMPIEVLEPYGKPSESLVFLLSGDGGWTSFDQGLADSFAKKGMLVIGVDSQKYFWNAKTPEEVTAETEKIIRFYLEEKHKSSFLIMGYSFGACVAPFIVTRLAEDLKSKLSGIALLSPDTRGDFEIHVADMLRIGNNDEGYNVVREIASCTTKKVCLFGSSEDKSVVSQFQKAGVLTEILPGDHHFNGNYEAITSKVLEIK